MRKFVFLITFLMLSSVFVSAQPISEIFKRMEQHQRALKSLRAEIAVSKFSVRSGGSYAKDGALTILPQKKDAYSVRLDSTKPEEQNFLIVANQYLIYFPASKIAYTGSAADSQKLMFYPFSDLSLKTLKPVYNILYTGEEKIGGTIRTWKLALTPKTPQNFDRIELWIDVNGMPLQWKINETNGDWTTVLLSKLQKNVDLNAAEFRINLPKGTKIIKESSTAAKKIVTQKRRVTSRRKFSRRR